jgi:hypothetical protein
VSGRRFLRRPDSTWAMPDQLIPEWNASASRLQPRRSLAALTRAPITESSRVLVSTSFPPSETAFPGSAHPTPPATLDNCQVTYSESVVLSDRHAAHASVPLQRPCSGSAATPGSSSAVFEPSPVPMVMPTVSVSTSKSTAPLSWSFRLSLREMRGYTTRRSQRPRTVGRPWRRHGRACWTRDTWPGRPRWPGRWQSTSTSSTAGWPTCFPDFTCSPSPPPAGRGRAEPSQRERPAHAVGPTLTPANERSQTLACRGPLRPRHRRAAQRSPAREVALPEHYHPSSASGIAPPPWRAAYASPSDRLRGGPRAPCGVRNLEHERRPRSAVVSAAAGTPRSTSGCDPGSA